VAIYTSGKSRTCAPAWKREAPQGRLRVGPDRRNRVVRFADKVDCAESELA